MLLEQVISGFQTGADIAGIEAARKCGLRTGGFIPKGFKTLEGPKPQYARLYGAIEHSSSNYAERTWDNVHNSDATIRFAKLWKSPGEICTLQAIRNWRRPSFDVDVPLSNNKTYGEPLENIVIDFLLRNNVRVLNIAGNSEETCPGIFEEVKTFLVGLFNKLKERDSQGGIQQVSGSGKDDGSI